jgi:hypothetical protein
VGRSDFNWVDSFSDFNNLGGTHDLGEVNKMCKFFSLVSQGDSKPLYFDAEMRKKIIKGKFKYESTDSHTSIADYFNHKGKDEDLLNKYEYDVWTKHLKIDHLGAKDDSKTIKDFCDNLDWTTIVPELKIKPIINPFKDIQTLEVTKADIKLLKEWDSVRDSVRDSVWGSVGASVWASVRDSVRASVGDSVWDSVRDSVWASVGDSVWGSVRDSVWGSVRDSVRASAGDSVWDSVRDSVWASVWDSIGGSVGDSIGGSVWAYIATFVDTKYKFDFSSAQKLWERRLVSSFDGTSWRLHGEGGKEVYKITPEELRRIK